jgi:hypothetical protein
VEDLETVGHDGYTDMRQFIFEGGGMERLLEAEGV